jgi:ribosome-associated heat shock protein Hsp15
MSRGGKAKDDDGDEAGASAQRLDKWLWFARLAKTRTQAAALVTEGRVRVNRERVDKPAMTLKAGDVVTATVHRSVRVLKVTGFIGRRGPAAEASQIYEELTPASDRTKAHAAIAPGSVSQPPVGAAHAVRRPGSGRPTKRERRDLDRLKDPSS